MTTDLLTTATLLVGDETTGREVVGRVLGRRGSGELYDRVVQESIRSWRRSASGPLSGLPPRQRAVVVCRHVDGRDEEQTAAAVGIPLDQVAPTDTRALERLGVTGAEVAGLSSVSVSEQPVRRLRRRRRWPWAVAGVLVVVGGAGALVAARPTSKSVPKAVRPVYVDPIANWGVTRGDLAADATFTAAVVKAGAGATTSPVKLLWAGSTPDGPVALTESDETETDDMGKVTRVQEIRVFATQKGRLLLTDAGPVGQERFSRRGFVFGTGDDGRTAVVVPALPDSTVLMSAHHTRVGGRIVRSSWAPLTLHGGAAVVAAGPDAVIRITVAGRPDRDFTAGGAPEPLAANYLCWFVHDPHSHCGNFQSTDTYVSDLDLTGGRLTAGPPYGDVETSGWLTQLGASPVQPALSNPMVFIETPDGGRVMATEYQLPGEPAHFAIVQFPDEQHPEVVLDEVQDLTARPLWAARLGDGNGWFVGSGPGRTITRWREAGGPWHELSPRIAALLPTIAPSIQVGLDDGSVTTHTA